MKVLGISDGMTGGATLMEDGQVLYAVHEERLIRAKMATGFPKQSIRSLMGKYSMKQKIPGIVQLAITFS